MMLSLQRLLFVVTAILSSTMMFSLCGCARMSGMVMNESGQAYYKQGNYTMARREFQKAMMDNPNNAHYAFNMAAASHKQGDIAVAEQAYRQALNMDPSHQPSYHGLATLMTDQGRGDEAQHLISSWAGSQPYAPESHVEMAWIQNKMGDSVGAEQSLRQALQINPQHEKALAQMGQVYEQQGRSHEAVSMYQKSLYQDPTQFQVKSRMAAIQTGNPMMNHGFASQAPPMMAEATMPVHATSPMTSQVVTNYPPTPQNQFQNMPPMQAQNNLNYAPLPQMSNLPASTTQLPSHANMPLGNTQPPMTSQMQPQNYFSPQTQWQPTMQQNQYPHMPAMPFAGNQLTQGYPTQMAPTMPPPLPPYSGQHAPAPAPQVSQGVPALQAF